MVQELSGIKRDKYPLNNADAANCKDDEDSGQETLSLVAAISDLKVRPLQDFGLNYTSEMVAHKGNEERQENCFTIERLESNGMLADEISGAKDQAQIPHNKILTA